MSSFKTAKGTELPILKLKGKDYLEVKYRLVWFREEHPSWSIETEFVHLGNLEAIARATIKDESGRILSVSHKHENKSGFADYHEKAESGAIGRALALLGYGTQFCADDLDEGDRIVDAPAQRVGLVSPVMQKVYANQGLGEYMCNVGRKYKGKKLKEISQTELSQYIKWLNSSKEPGSSLGKAAEEFISKAEMYIKLQNPEEKPNVQPS